MKIKVDFVTNSSSASFMIAKSCINEKQIVLIHNHIEAAQAFIEPGQRLYLDQWIIEEKKHVIQGHTSMDNFDMGWFLKKIGVDMECVHFEGANYGGY